MKISETQSLRILPYSHSTPSPLGTILSAPWGKQVHFLTENLEILMEDFLQAKLFVTEMSNTGLL